MKSFVVIYRGEDEPYLTHLTEANLQTRLDDGDYGDCKFLKQSDFSGNLMEFPSNSMLILEATVVIPQAVQKVVTYKL